MAASNQLCIEKRIAEIIDNQFQQLIIQNLRFNSMKRGIRHKM